MDQRPLVVLLGDSVLMDGVAVGLADRQALGVVRVEGSTLEIGERLRTLEPDLIVVELDNPQSPSILSLLREQPDTLVLGLELNCNRVLVLNSHQHAARTMTELFHVVRAEVSQTAHEEKGGDLPEIHWT